MLQRLIEAQLGAAGLARTAARCLEMLRQYHLNAPEKQELLTWMCSITKLTPEQKRGLRSLCLEDLGDEREIARRAVARSGSNTLSGAKGHERRALGRT